MTAKDDRGGAAVRYAVLVSGLLIGFMVAGRATRDALFLAQFPVTSIPAMVGSAALVSLLVAIGMSKVLSRFGPGRLLPILLSISAALTLFEWGLYQRAPQAAAVLVFLQFQALGALMVSVFWSLGNERFDPRTAKRAFGWIGTAGTVGGVLGGLLTERAGTFLPVHAMLPIMSAIHLICVVLVLRIREAVPARSEARAQAPPPAVEPAGFRALSRSPYLRMLAAFLIMATLSEQLLDYVFKDFAKASFSSDELLRFFALFYTGINLVAGVLGTAVGRQMLERLGIARTVSLLPWSVATCGLGAVIFPGLGSIVFARGAEATMRNSLYRSGFELLFTPMPPAEKRAAKPLLDVGAVRSGDIMAAMVVQAALFAWPAQATTLMLMAAVFVSAFSILLTFRIHRGYVTALEHNLLARAFQLELGDAVFDRTTRMTMARLTPAPGPALPELDQAGPPAVTTFTGSPALLRLHELYSEDAARVEASLRIAPLEPIHVARALRLLGRDSLYLPAHEALSAVAARHAGQLVDALLDPASDPVTRRRIPAVLAAAQTARAVDGLLLGLHDERFEIRSRCGRALLRLATAAPQLVIDSQRVIAAILNEVAVDRHVWESQHLMEEDADDPLQLGGALKERRSRSLEHVFTVLSLVMPRQPLQIAFHGLYAEDPQLRGTALEYLETSLPEQVREKLWPFIGDRPMRPRTTRPREQVVAELIAARSSIMLNLEDIKKL